MLVPLEQATIRLQGRPGSLTGEHIWEILPVFEWLLRHFEELKVRYDKHPNTHFRHNINLAWMKLDKYYSLTRSPIEQQRLGRLGSGVCNCTRQYLHRIRSRVKRNG